MDETICMDLDTMSSTSSIQNMHGLCKQYLISTTIGIIFSILSPLQVIISTLANGITIISIDCVTTVID